MTRLKFADPLAELIARGEKSTTWRVDDDKGLAEGDDLELIHKSTGRLFGGAVIKSVRQRTFSTLEPQDYEGHEPFPDDETMLATYRGYYNNPNIGLDTPVTVVKFALWLRCNRPGDDETDVWVVR